jgi:hypothetical protein
MSNPQGPNLQGQTPQWLEWARRLQAIAQTGLEYCKDPYDRQRYEQIRGLAAEMAAKGAGLADAVALVELFKNERGYATPKIDIRTAVFDGDRILLVKEREDGLGRSRAAGQMLGSLPAWRRLAK